ncbi:hypothetical protein M409DRAFT_16639 [Zasmidium cellare ATCC 36951]|uniref:EthD domain-containing protein n=1 Tax=Zasmidium cellare ATCC 36951 TaxID=1080233 RepID=A0A6A6CZL0_ZASCE|nr:uncharacterized protein M409DRAFT_16639 [Zasmidium cellare ATCC 36951]KAF2172677.1 hypothetical protein M409DRAFT_16639 [Zasmidium cellare ATCC 36951]
MGSLPTEPQRLLAWTIYIKKPAHQSQEDHHAHVSNINTPLTTPFLKKYGIVRYTVKHNDASILPLRQQLMAGMPDDSILDYDCVLEMIVRDIECIQRMQKDEEFVRECLSDHGNFADMKLCKGSLMWIEEFAF